MATSDSRNDPLTSFNFIVTVENMRAGFSEVGGLSSETDVIEYREGNEKLSRRSLPGLTKFTKLSLKRGLTTDAKEIHAWRKTVIDGKTQRKGGTITLLNEAREPAITWEFSEGWPCKLAGPAMNAKNNEVALEEVELCIETLTRQT